MKNDSINTVADFYSLRAGYPLRTLKVGIVTVVPFAERDAPKGLASHRRCALWMGVTTDRAVIVTETEVVSRLQALVDRLDGLSSLMAKNTVDKLCAALEDKLSSGKQFARYFGRKYFCDSKMLVRVSDSNVRRLTADNAQAAISSLRSVGIPDDTKYLLAEGSAFAYYHDGVPVAFAATHPVGEMSNRIGKIMVGTLPGFRRRGYGKAVVATATSDIVSKGKVAVWGMAHDNMPAMKTASAVGYEQYCEVFELRVVSEKNRRA